MTDRDYLLGRLSPDDATRFEDELLTDEAAYERLGPVEDDLIDEYASGRMSEADRRDFERSPLARRERVVFARALSTRARTSNVVVPFPRSRIALAAAAMLVVAVGATMFLLSRREDPMPTTAPRIAKQAEPPVVPLRVLAVTLATGRTRGGETEREVTAITPDVATLQLRVRVHAEDIYDAYSVALRRGGTEVWRGQARAESSRGERIVIADVPASSLPAGTYEVRVSGNEDPLGFATLEVRR